MEIKNEEDEKGGNFFMEDNNRRIGLMHYLFAGPHKMIIVHTEVDEAYEGRGLGMQLVKAGVEYARAHQMKILARCPFAKKIFEITPAFADVLV
ncbi:MAG TPA: GNAT family N-acetyltransferase [Mucilaginibacter sp.]